MLLTDIHHNGVVQAAEEGLSKKPKRLPSWLFYDETGDKIFQSIMHMPEYYLTASEYEILERCKNDLLNHFTKDGTPFNLVELGAGDGLKTEILLEHFVHEQVPFHYSPVDVSKTVLTQLRERLTRSVPGVVIKPVHKRYSEALSSLHETPGRKVFLFLGANIGNFTTEEATLFMKRLYDAMEEDDQLLVGFDLKKDPEIIHRAYDDPHGITKSFNINLLDRLNREIGANFNREQFDHYPYYDPETGTMKSYLISLTKQDVYIERCDRVFHFAPWETIHTEVSQKYDIPMIEHLAEKARLEITECFYDRKGYFCNVLFGKQ